jgi:purine-binding chemotaxis protein CheW
MNLRGTVIPIVDLRIRFGMTDQQYSKFTVVIVVKVRAKAVGLVVDAVSDVLEIASSDVRETPDCGRTDLRFITGIATVGEKLVVLLETEKLLNDEEITAVA